MKRHIIHGLLIAALAVLSGCLVCGQNIIIEPFDFTGKTGDPIESFDVDLNTNADYKEHKDDIKSIDGISVVAQIVNNTGTPARARIYISDDPNLSSRVEIMEKATLVFESPEVPGNGSLLVDWEDSFKRIRNPDELKRQILGDGIFTVYGITQSTPFSVTVKGEIVLTLTACK